MKILFFISGIGYGDSTREHAIIEELIKKDKKTEILILGYDTSYNYFKDKFNTVKMRSWKLYGYNLKFKLFPFFMMNSILPFLWLANSIRIKKLIKKFDADLVISDFEPAAGYLAKLIKKKCILVLAYDPKQQKEFTNKNLSINLQISMINNIYKSKNLYKVIISTLLKKQKSYLKYEYINPIIRTQPDELSSEKVLMKKLDLKKKPVLIMLGGSDFGLTLANKVFKIISKFKENFIVFGYSTKFSRENITVFKFKENFLEYLKICKGIITLAGYNTLAESIVYKKPMLVFPIKNHFEQELNALTVKDFALIGSENLEESIKKFLKIIPSLQSKMNKLRVKATGASEAADIILKLKKE
ncbi:hypothetical protein CL621_01985 [archaeon]|nr:hypothetical protein [archaeon]|tara:strand:- start:1070 stop:2143 length:1074 start_codon:yes stop_codon:yes gene_type:complete